MKKLAAVFDLETSNLTPDFAILLCGVVQPVGGVQKIFRIDGRQVPGEGGGKRWTRDDGRLAGALVEELGKYNILVAHNGAKFDRRFLNGRALHHNLPILNPRGNIIDPLILAWRHLNLKFNSLEKLAWFLGCEKRKTPTVPDTWLAATIDHDPAALQTIVDHCVADVDLLCEVADRMQALVGPINSWGSA